MILRRVKGTIAVALTSTPTVYAKNGAVYASSRDVAAFFGKQHKNVLRDIEALIEDAPSCALNFELTSLRVAMPRGGFRDEPAFDMTRDGFTLLAMGFNGKPALAFKLRYIEEFNRMDAQLRAPVQPVLPDFTDPGEAAIAWGGWPYGSCIWR